MSVISVLKYVYGRWRYFRQLLAALAWPSVSWACRTSNTENSYSIWQVFLYCSILCQEVPSQFLWSHTYLQRILASKLKHSCEFTVKKKVKKLVNAILFPEYLISTKSVSPACPFVGMRFTKISEIIIIIIIVINISIINIIISCYCGIVLAVRHSYYGITIQFKIMFFYFFV